MTFRNISVPRFLIAIAFVGTGLTILTASAYLGLIDWRLEDDDLLIIAAVTSLIGFGMSLPFVRLSVAIQVGLITPLAAFCAMGVIYVVAISLAS